MAQQINLEEISVEEQRRLYDYLSMQFQQRAPGPELGRLEHACWKVVTQILESRGVRPIPPLPIFVKHFGSTRFANAIDSLDRFVRGGSDVPLTHVSHMAVCRLVLSCLCDHLEKKSKPLSASILLGAVSFLPSVMNKALPGYYSARLLYRVVQLTNAA